MTFDHHVLLWLLAVPLLGAAVVALLGPQRGREVRWISLGVSLVALVLSFILAGRFLAYDQTEEGIQFGPRGISKARIDGKEVPTFKPVFVPGASEANPHATTWDILRFRDDDSSGTRKTGAIQFFLGIDGLNIWLVVLTAVLFLPSVLISWNHIDTRVNEFFAWLLALQTAMMGIFLAFDIVLFYVFFEVSLVPLFFLIGIWGGPQRQYAARKFFIYTLVGSLITLLGVLGVILVTANQTGEMTFSIPRLVELVHSQLTHDDPSVRAYWGSVQLWVFIGLIAGFSVKVPLVPFHTWLPLAHVEAPTAGSVDLAGVLLKVGCYGFLRLCIPLAPDVSLSLGLPLITAVAAFGIVYGAFCAYAQQDVKRLIAYSSVSHLGLCMLGMYSLTAAGLTGSLMQMINHGLSTAALFLLIGMIYERYHTRDLDKYGGMAEKMPLFGVFLMFMCLSSAGLPGLNGFVGEILCIAGIFQHEYFVTHRLFLAVAAVSGVVLGAWYLFTMMRKLLFGPVKEPEHHGPPIKDLEPREWLLLTPIVILCVVLGVYPQPVLKSMQPDVDTIVLIADKARQRVTTPVTDSAALPPAGRPAGDEKLVDQEQRGDDERPADPRQQVEPRGHGAG